MDPPIQGEQAGRRFPPAIEEERDPVSGARVRRLTGFRAHSNHVYFTNSGWYDDGRKILFDTDRGGTHDLYSVDLETGSITRLTDLPPPTARTRQLGSTTSVNPGRDEAYFWHDGVLLALDLETLGLRALYREPEGFTSATAHSKVTADGEYVCTSVVESVPGDTAAEVWDAHPTTRVLRVPVDGGDAEVLHVEDEWLCHVQPSPTRPDLLTFAQEGPWDRTDQRIWGLDAETGEAWKIRPEAPGEEVGHEFWLADGETVCYHGRDGDGEAFFGFARYDGSEREEHPVPADLLRFGRKVTQSHFHALDRDLVVADGSPEFPYVIALAREGDGYGPPRILARHGTSSFEFGRLHVHPRFSPDGGSVLFLSDRTEYANLYLADVPPVGEMPLAEDV